MGVQNLTPVIASEAFAERLAMTINVPIQLFTSRILDFNADERVIERQALRASDQYPSPSALKRINK